MPTENPSRDRSPFAGPFGILTLTVLALAIGLVLFYAWVFSLDRRGDYHNSAEAADLDGDGDLDVVLHNLRQESESVAFGATTLWVNQGDGRFSSGALELPNLPPYLYLSAGGGDMDRDGDTDLLFLTPFQLRLVINQGGVQGGETGAFKLGSAFGLSGNSGFPGSPGSLLLGDLDDDGLPDGFIPGCCGMTWTPSSDQPAYIPPMTWVWINAWEPGGWPDRQAVSPEWLDEIPIRGAASGDLDGDGDIDVYAAVQAPKKGRDTNPADLLLLNDGAGGFSDSGQRLGASDSTSVALGDLDADGDLDAVAGAADGALVWVNQGGSRWRPAGHICTQADHWQRRSRGRLPVRPGYGWRPGCIDRGHSISRHLVERWPGNLYPFHPALLLFQAPRPRNRRF